MNKNSTIKADVEFIRKGDDCGVIFEVICPICGDRIKVADHGWWDTKCECGYKWDLVVYAEGYKDEVL